RTDGRTTGGGNRANGAWGNGARRNAAGGSTAWTGAAGDSTARAGSTRGSTARAKSRTSIRTRSRTGCRTDPTSTVYTGLGGKQAGDHRPERGECALRPGRVVVGSLDADRGGAVRVPEGQAGRGRGARVAPRGADPGAGWPRRARRRWRAAAV